MNQNIEQHIQSLVGMIENQQLEEALDYLETLSQEERDCWEIQNVTGIICSYCGQLDEAVAFYRGALEKSPDNAELYYNLADAYLCQGAYEHAELMLKSCESITTEAQLLDGVEQMRERIAAYRAENQEEKKDNSVLMVAYYFPPLSGSGVFRSIKFAKYLPELGWNPTVISAEEPPRGWNYRDDSLVKEIPDSVDVIRIADEVCTKNGVTFSQEKVNELLAFLKSVLRYDKESMEIVGALQASKQGIVQLLSFPCGCLSWAWDVVKYIENKMDIRKYQVIYTTSGPSSSHLVGFYLKKKYGIPWVADYRDAWTDNPYANYDKSNSGYKLLFALERILLKYASCNLTIGQGMVPDYLNHFGLKKTQIVPITNGYDEEDFAQLQYREEKTKKFTINYSGLLYTQQHNMKPILHAIKQLHEEGKIDLNKVTFRVVGEGNESANRAVIEECGLAEIYEQSKGYVSHAEALQANLDADMLLLLIGTDERFKPVYTGKVFEYLRSGKKILALAPKDGAVDRMLGATGHGRAFLDTEISEIKEEILQEYQLWLNSDRNEYMKSPLCKLYERRYLTMKLADVLYEVKKRVRVATNNKKKKYLVICTGGYPVEGGKKANIFAHKRIMKYVEAGLDIEVFGFMWGAAASYNYAYEGINVVCGGEAHLIEKLMHSDYEMIMVHFPDYSVFKAIAKAGKLYMPMLVWCHGYEVTPWYRTWFNYSHAQIQEQKQALDKSDEHRRAFLKDIFSRDNIHFIFVSNWQRGRVKKWVGNLPVHHDVIHNFLDFELFNIPEKKAEDRLHILSIKSHSARTYANDLTANAILELSNKPFFEELTFELYGDGALFEANYGELLQRNFTNVHIHREFLSQQQMKQLFAENGIFLSPTRMDSHQVTASEAMAAGMAVVTSNAGPMREFMDEDCASIFEFDNYLMMAEEIEYLYYHPEEYLKICKNAKMRSRQQCGDDKTVQREIELIKKMGGEMV